MYLSAAKVKLLEKLLWELNETRNNMQTRRFVGAPLLALLDADYFASYTWNVEQGAFDACVSLNMSAVNIEAYRTYYRHCDPITDHLQRRIRLPW